MADKKFVKVVFTFTSGKSIVYTMSDENASSICEDWKNFKSRDDNKKIKRITEILKTAEGQMLERLYIDLDKVDAIQIDVYSTGTQGE